MARRNNNDNEPATLIPITLVAGRVGYPDEIVWNRLEPSDVIRDWDGGHCVSWSKAKSLVAEFTAAKEDAEEVTRQRNEEHERKLAAENDRLRREAAERAALQRQRVLPGGISIDVPGTSEPPWAESGEDE